MSFGRQRQTVRDERVVVIGAGIGGLVGALAAARPRPRRHCASSAPRRPAARCAQVEVGGAPARRRPTVLHHALGVRGDLSPSAGACARRSRRRCARPSVLARHAWARRCDGWTSSPTSSARADAIAAFAGARRGATATAPSAAGPRGIYDTLERPFIRAAAAQPAGLVRRVGRRAPALWRISPFATLWRALGDFFRDPRLRQLFGRYATYCGSSPFRAPATLMLVAHVEQEGVWLVEGGMHRLAAGAGRPRRAARRRPSATAPRSPRSWSSGGRAAGRPRSPRASGSRPTPSSSTRDVGGARRTGCSARPCAGAVPASAAAPRDRSRPSPGC